MPLASLREFLRCETGTHHLARLFRAAPYSSAAASPVMADTPFAVVLSARVFCVNTGSTIFRRARVWADAIRPFPDAPIFARCSADNAFPRCATANFARCSSVFGCRNAGWPFIAALNFCRDSAVHTVPLDGLPGRSFRRSRKWLRCSSVNRYPRFLHAVAPLQVATARNQGLSMRSASSGVCTENA
jgi:hypothetical protein